MLVAWDNKTMLDHKSIKGLIAELVACVGPEVAKEVIVDLSDPWFMNSDNSQQLELIFIAYTISSWQMYRSEM